MQYQINQIINTATDTNLSDLNSTPTTTFNNLNSLSTDSALSIDRFNTTSTTISIIKIAH